MADPGALMLVRIVNPNLPRATLYGAIRERDWPFVEADALHQGAEATALSWSVLPVREWVPEFLFNAVVGPYATGLRRVMTLGVAEEGEWQFWLLPQACPAVPGE